MRKQDWSPRNESENAFENFAAKYGITADIEPTDENPWMSSENGGDQQWARTANHWQITLKRGRKRFVTYFSQGSAATEDPEIKDLLHSLSMDARGVEDHQTFEQWAREYGYDEDSRKAEKSYNLTRKIANSLKKFLGDELYKEFLWKMDTYGEVDS